MNHQHGAALLLTLVVLVAMLFSMLALMRSSGASTIVAGNMAFKNAAMGEANVGFYEGIRTLAPCGTAPCGKFSDPSYISFAQLPEATLLDPTTWATNPLVHSLADSDSNSKYTVRYLIDRLSDSSQLTNIHDSTQVEKFSFGFVVKDKWGSNDSADDSTVLAMPTVFYRITVRVEGPNDTLYMAQATVTVSGI